MVAVEYQEPVVPVNLLAAESLSPGVVNGDLVEGRQVKVKRVCLRKTFQFDVFAACRSKRPSLNILYR